MQPPGDARGGAWVKEMSEKDAKYGGQMRGDGRANPEGKCHGDAGGPARHINTVYNSAHSLYGDTCPPLGHTCHAAANAPDASPPTPPGSSTPEQERGEVEEKEDVQGPEETLRRHLLQQAPLCKQ